MWQLAQGREAMVRKARADRLLVPYTEKSRYIHASIMLYPH